MRIEIYDAANDLWVEYTKGVAKNFEKHPNTGGVSPEVAMELWDYFIAEYEGAGLLFTKKWRLALTKIDASGQMAVSHYFESIPQSELTTERAFFAKNMHTLKLLGDYNGTHALYLLSFDEIKKNQNIDDAEKFKQISEITNTFKGVRDELNAELAKVHLSICAALAHFKIQFPNGRVGEFSGDTVQEMTAYLLQNTTDAYIFFLKFANRSLGFSTVSSSTLALLEMAKHQKLLAEMIERLHGTTITSLLSKTQ